MNAERKKWKYMYIVNIGCQVYMPYATRGDETMPMKDPHYSTLGLICIGISFTSVMKPMALSRTTSGCILNTVRCLMSLRKNRPAPQIAFVTYLHHAVSIVVDSGDAPFAYTRIIVFVIPRHPLPHLSLAWHQFCGSIQHNCDAG